MLVDVNCDKLVNGFLPEREFLSCGSLCVDVICRVWQISMDNRQRGTGGRERGRDGGKEGGRKGERGRERM